MPTISVYPEDLFERLGKSYNQEEFSNLCFEFGIELDEVTTEHVMSRKREGDNEERVVYKIDIPANRYDLLCIEGLARALNIFMGKELLPKYILNAGNPPIKAIVKKNVEKVRPYFVCAVLRNLNLGLKGFNSFLDLQDKLHFNICRQRTLVAIGTHDLDTIQPPFTYDALPPEEIRFVALAQNEEKNAKELMDFYRDPKNVDFKHLKPYADMIYDWERYPVIKDKNGIVLSLPPVVNGRHTEMSKDTKNVFIDVTATDLTKARIVLNQLVCLFSEYSETKFSIETVEVEYENGNHYTSPDLSNKTIEVSIDKMNQLLGLHEPVETIQKQLYKMELESEYNNENKEKNSLTVFIPPTRADIIHSCDIVEDLAIAHGYNNLERIPPPVNTIGSEQPLNKLSDLLRYEIAAAGYTEIMTLALCGREEASVMLNHKLESINDICVSLSNPKTIEFQICRINLLTGMLKTIQNNKAIKMKDGLKLFEISDVVLKDERSDTGCRNERRCIACYMGPSAGLEIIHGLIDRIMELLNVKSHVKETTERKDDNNNTMHYYLKPFDDEMYFKGRSAEVILERSDGSKEVIGTMGIIHPQVLSNFELVYPCSVMEINIEPFV